RRHDRVVGACRGLTGLRAATLLRGGLIVAADLPITWGLRGRRRQRTGDRDSTWRRHVARHRAGDLREDAGPRRREPEPYGAHPRPPREHLPLPPLQARSDCASPDLLAGLRIG